MSQPQPMGDPPRTPPAAVRIDGLLIATKNKGKVKEFRQILGGDSIGFAIDDLSSFPDVETVAEDGATFQENACLKATGYAKATKRWALADDSGLCVDALNGAPGVHSARWAEAHGEGSGDEDNKRFLRKQLRGVPDADRTARFVCALALADPAGRIVLTSQGMVQGRVINAARGSGGFGYDPIFLIDALGRTAAQLEPDEKHAISHRGEAMRRMATLMAEYQLIRPAR
jgi:XTP/dITP diphosphohydrolase